MFRADSVADFTCAATAAWSSEGARKGLSPWILKFDVFHRFLPRGCFLSFVWLKWNFATPCRNRFGHPWKIRQWPLPRKILPMAPPWKIPNGSSLEKSFRWPLPGKSRMAPPWKNPSDGPSLEKSFRRPWTAALDAHRHSRAKNKEPPEEEIEWWAKRTRKIGCNVWRLHDNLVPSEKIWAAWGEAGLVNTLAAWTRMIRQVCLHSVQHT